MGKTSSVPQLIPLMLHPIRAGFPNPAEDPVDRMIDFNELIIQHPAATFALRVEGDSMENAGIYSGDIVVVDKSLEPRHGDVVVAAVDGDFTLKYLHKRAGKVFLRAANPAYEPIELNDGAVLWGCVTFVVSKRRTV